MARKRMIDPNIWQSEDFGKLSALAKIVFIGLFSLADDEGRGRANPTYLKSSLFPYEESMRSADIEKTLSEISSNMSVIFYSYDGNMYYSLYNWNIWQTINRPTPSKILEFDEDNKDIQRLFNEPSMSTHGELTPKRKEKNRIEIEKENKDSSSTSAKASKHEYGEYKHVLLKDEELQKLKEEYPNWEDLIKYLDEYIEMKGYKAKSHYLCIKKWVVDAVKRQSQKDKIKTTFNQREYKDLNTLYSNL